MKKNYLIPATVILVVAGFAGYLYWSFNRPPADTESINTPPSAGEIQPDQPQPDPNAPNYGFPFLDTSMLKPPAGSKVAIFVFEDLECPACAHAFPVVRSAVEHYNIPLVRHDFPLTEIHVWSFEAAVTARYLQDRVSSTLADRFRGDVFANQTKISNTDDLEAFTRAWFQSHHQTLPSDLAGGICASEVKADRALGDRLGIHSTPCILVVTQSKWVPVTDVRQLDQIVNTALAETAAISTPADSGLTARPPAHV